MGVQPAESLERGTDNEDEYMISDQELLVNRFISVPRDMGQLNCGSYVSGIVRVRLLHSSCGGNYISRAPRLNVFVASGSSSTHTRQVCETSLGRKLHSSLVPFVLPLQLSPRPRSGHYSATPPVKPAPASHRPAEQGHPKGNPTPPRAGKQCLWVDTNSPGTPNMSPSTPEISVHLYELWRRNCGAGVRHSTLLPPDR